MGSDQEPQVEFAQEALTTFVRPDQSPLDVQDPKPAPRRVEDELARVQDALVISDEARRKAEAEVAFLKVEQTSLLLEVGATKDEVSSLQSQEGKDKATMEDYQKALELIFAYGYGCYMFKHNICGDQLEVPNGMLDSSDLLLL